MHPAGSRISENEIIPYHFSFEWDRVAEDVLSLRRGCHRTLVVARPLPQLATGVVAGALLHYHR
jgi:hypothetical protein